MQNRGNIKIKKHVLGNRANGVAVSTPFLPPTLTPTHPPASTDFFEKKSRKELARKRWLSYFMNRQPNE
jgi:hypothetical protein